MRRIALVLFVCFGAIAAHAQCSPFGGVGDVQFLDNSGNVLTNGVLYSFQAGTSTQQATFTDSTCTVQNVNPITFGTGARVAIWLTTANFYKFVLCAQNDGASCAGGDILFSVDQVPGGVSGGGGGGGSPFISASANPATSGILRLASGDTVCWRNAANSANLCFKKDSNDLLSWDGGSLKLPEVAAPTSVTGFDILYADSTAHRYKQCSNGVACAQIANAGVDISATDQVTQLHFGSTSTPLSGTAPLTNQFLQWNGTNLIGAPTEVAVASVLGGPGQTLTSAIVICSLTSQACENIVLAGSHTLIRFVYVLATAPVGCSTAPGIGVRDITAASNVYNTTIANGATLTTVDSGALNLAMTAGHTFGIGPTQQPAGCSTNAIVEYVTAIYQ